MVDLISVLSAEKIRVCVIGAGAAGLCAIRHLSADRHSFEFTAFEQAPGIGGTWIYVENTGLDDNGQAIHSSMYKNLRTNIPLRLMNFPDFQRMAQSRPSCGTHEQVLSYLKDYDDYYQLSQYIQFNTKVESVKPTTIDHGIKESTWNVKVRNLKTQITEERTFDAIMVCNGHYANPKIPKVQGIETFEGDVVHSHDYRKPGSYSEKTVMVLGAGPSGIDIAIELSHCAKLVYLSHNTPKLSSTLPPNLSQVLGIESVNGDEFHLKDGTVVVANVLMYCTGYWFSFPFLESCGIRVTGNHVTPLFQHLINIEHPTMAIVGVPSRVIPFPQFHMQAQYFLRLLKGHVTLPNKEEMLVQASPTSLKHPHVLGDAQWEYNDALADAAGIDRLPAFYKNGSTLWNKTRIENLLHYKNSEIRIDGSAVEIIV